MRRVFSRMLEALLLASVLTLSSVLLGKFSLLVKANPIPIPTLIMPYEYINATISLVGGNMLAKVDGLYPFVDVNYTTVRMDYPLPPNATNIQVLMNDTTLSWTYNNKIYPTILGNWPMINWTIQIAPKPGPITGYFVIKTHYEHFIPLMGENCAFLYAMGTGRFLQTYAKHTTACLRMRMETHYSDLHVYTVGNVNGTWIGHPANYSIVHQNLIDIITLNVTSQIWEPLKEDFMMTFSTRTGGYAIHPHLAAPTLFASYMALVAVFVGVFVAVKRKKRLRTIS